MSDLDDFRATTLARQVEAETRLAAGLATTRDMMR